MRSIKKIAALVLSLAMLATMFAFSASAAAEANLYLEGPDKATVGDIYTVSVRLSDAGNEVGGFQGKITYTNAEYVSAQIHPNVLNLNDATADLANTVVTDNGSTVDFVTVTDVKGTNPANAIWFKVSFKVTAAGATFTLNGEKLSNKTGTDTVAETVTGEALAPAVVSDAFAINEIGMKNTTDAKTQGLVYKVTFAGGEIPEGATEYGMVFYPTSLLNGELTVNTEGAVKANVVEGDAAFDTIPTDDGSYWAYLNFAFENEDTAYKFLGTRITARAYYVVDGTAYYSDNTSADVTDGVANKAVLNVAKEFVAGYTGDADMTAVNAAIADLDGANFKENRGTLLQFVVDNF